MLDEIKIVQINTGINNNSSPYRLHLALKKIGINTNILTMNSETNAEQIHVAKCTLMFRILRKIDYLILELERRILYKNKIKLPFSFYRVGYDLTKEMLVKDADIVMIHWVCGTFLSPNGLRKILKLKKPVIIVCHDSWQFTGGCHVRLGCDRFSTGCGRCPQLQSNKERDWSSRLLKMKLKAISGYNNIRIISPSNWMDSNVEKSLLYKGYKHYVIPNPIDISDYLPSSKEDIRKKWGIPVDEYVILFGAVKVTTTPYKGYRELMNAFDYFEKEIGYNRKIGIYGFGSDSGETRRENLIQINYLGHIDAVRMAEIYKCADVFVMSSLDDNLPRTVMESLACAVPVVAFETGGVPDMVVHKENGYLAQYGNAVDLAYGIKWVMDNNNDNILGKEGRKKVIRDYKEEVVAMKYKQVFEEIICEDV